MSSRYLSPGDRVVYWPIIGYSTFKKVGTVMAVDRTGIISVENLQGSFNGQVEIISDSDQTRDIVDRTKITVIIRLQRVINLREILETDGKGAVLRECLKTIWGRFVFRRVQKINTNFSNGKVLYSTHKGTEIFDVKSCNPDKYSDLEMDRNVAFVYSDFNITTTKSQLRRNDNFRNMNLKLWSGNYQELNWNGCPIFHFYKKSNSERMIPRIGRLVCGMVNPAGAYKSWFVASEQFYKLWTCIMYGREAYPKNNSYDQLIKRMKCNTGAEWIQNNSDASDEEKEKHFYVSRAETVSKYYYLYQAIATFIFQKDKFEEKTQGWGESFPGEVDANKWIEKLYEYVCWMM